MSKPEQKIIMYESAEAASQMTVTGWVSRSGRFWGNDEHMARWEGCTHKLCDCGEVTEKHYTKCSICRDKAEYQRYMALERKEWDGKAPICIYGGDQYFWDEDGLLDYCEENNCAPEDLRLVFCEPTYAKEIEGSEYYCDDLAEDCDLPAELQAAFDELNERIRACREPLSWFPGKVAVQMPTVEAKP